MCHILYVHYDRSLIIAVSLKAGLKCQMLLTTKRPTFSLPCRAFFNTTQNLVRSQMQLFLQWKMSGVVTFFSFTFVILSCGFKQNATREQAGYRISLLASLISSFLLCRWMIAKQRAAFAVRPCPMLLPPLRGWPRSRMDTRTHVTGTRRYTWPWRLFFCAHRQYSSFLKMHVDICLFIYECVCVYSAALQC